MLLDSSFQRGNLDQSASHGNLTRTFPRHNIMIIKMLDSIKSAASWKLHLMRQIRSKLSVYEVYCFHLMEHVIPQVIVE